MTRTLTDATHLRAYLATQWRRAFGVNVSRFDERLFIGGQFRPDQWPVLHTLGVRAVLSLQEEYEDVFEGHPPERTLRLLVPDYHPPTVEQLREAVAFITAAHADNLPVMIHCHAGVGRAPLTAAAYLIARGHAADAALEAIRIVRPIVALNEIQMARLQEWAQVATHMERS
jgi:protein-tyrosine phosphatase